MGARHGFDVINSKTRKRSNPQTWAQFEAEVARQAFKWPRRKPNMTNLQLANLVPAGQFQFLKHVTRPCKFIKANGERCKCWSMRGASRCVRHGGYREKPSHPATIRLFENGTITRRSIHRVTSAAMYNLRTPREREARSAARKLLKQYRRQVRAVEVMEGVAAFLADDGGRAWHRWFVQVCATVVHAR